MNVRATRFPWLFSPAVDLAAFLGSALLAFGLLIAGHFLGVLHSDSPEWTWVTAILLIDVAHVYATAFRVYFDPIEFRRRRGLYLLTPVIAFAIGWAVYSEYGSLIFWRVLAYLAVFHFVRQQYGWVALYRQRGNETDRRGYWIDSAAIYLATLYPLVWWHAHLPRQFGWFLDSSRDFLNVPAITQQVLEPVYWTSLLIYALRALGRGLRCAQWNPGKDIVVMTTAICWHVGIITFNSDYAFTVTNVVIHGIPYFVVVYWSWSGAASRVPLRSQDSSFQILSRLAPASRCQRIVVFFATLWLLAFIEELLWDRGVWHERAWLFGSGWHRDAFDDLLIPLLAVPQITHYILDGFIWKRRSNPSLQQTFSPSAA
ncbi:MAG: hypothetical protein ACYTGL_12995 [Planctomycetota bacterium]